MYQYAHGQLNIGDRNSKSVKIISYHKYINDIYLWR